MAIPQLRVPDVGQPGTPTATHSAVADANTFGAGIAQGLDTLSKGVGSLAGYLKDQAEAAVKTKNLLNFSTFQTQFSQQLNQMQQDAPLDTTDFVAKADAEYAKQSKQFLATVPIGLQDEFSLRVASAGQGVNSTAIGYQNTLNNAFFTKAVGDQYDLSSTAVGNNPTIHNLDKEQQKLNEVIASTNLPAPRKAELAQTYGVGLAKTVYKQLWVQQSTDEALGLAGAQPIAADLIQNTQGVSPDEAASLATAAESVGASELGATTWSALPARARGALMSLIADKGELPASVQAAAQSGDLLKVAKSVAALGGADREAEAARILAIGKEELAVDDNPSFNNIPYEDRVALRKDAEGEVNQQLTAQRQQTTAIQNAKVNDLMSGIFDGTKGLADIDNARQEGWLNQEADIAQATALYDKKNQQVILAQGALDKLASGQAFDPTSTDDKNGLNAVVGDSGIQALQAKNSDWATSFLVPLARQAQDIPTDVSGSLTGMMRSKDQGTALWALDVMSQLKSVSPDAFTQRFGADVESDVNFWETRKDFMQPDDLLANIRRGMSPQERQNTQALRTQAQDYLTQDTSPGSHQTWQQKFMQDVTGSYGSFGGVFGIGASNAAQPATPWVQSQLSSDFSNMFQDEYVKYGDPKVAEDAAIKDLKMVWGVSSTNGTPTLMRYPPEKYYPQIAGSFDWMGAQLRDEGIIQDNEGFQLVTDQQTEAEVDALKNSGAPPPSYLLVRIRDGQPHQLQGMDGAPMRQFFSPTQADKAEQRKWEQERSKQFTQADLSRSLGLAVENSVNTGIPIPNDAYGIRYYMMGVPDAAKSN